MAAIVKTKRGFRQATAADVREWAAANDRPAGGSRGRLPDATIEAFNAAHATGKGRMFYGGTPVGVREYVLTGPKGGVKARAEVKSHDLRVWAALKGYVVSDRGRIPNAVKVAYMEDATS